MNKFSFRAEEIQGVLGLAVCGNKDGYQVQIQDSLNTSIRLLSETPDPDVAPEPRLVALAREVNDFFESRAKALLNQKRAELRSSGKPGSAERAEVTVFLTDRGLQLGFSYALERKEMAPTPRKSLLRRLLGPLSLGRVLWTMPTRDGLPSVTTRVRWPLFAWLLIVLAALGLTAYGLWFSDGMLGVK